MPQFLGNLRNDAQHIGRVRRGHFWMGCEHILPVVWVNVGWLRSLTETLPGIAGIVLKGAKVGEIGQRGSVLCQIKNYVKFSAERLCPQAFLCFFFEIIFRTRSHCKKAHTPRSLCFFYRKSNRIFNYLFISS